MRCPIKKCCTFLAPWLLMALAGCASTYTTGAFAEVNRIETELRKGVSKKTDVERVLGKPNGSGSSILPTESTPREVWFYQDIEISGMKREPGGIMRLSQRQQILLLFFRGETYDGFMWFTTAGIARAVAQ